MILLINASAALVFISCMLRLAIRRRRETDSAYAGSHRRPAGESPSPTLRYAIATAGTHGLGMIRKSPGL